MMPVNGTSYSKLAPFLGLYVEYMPTNQPGRLLFDGLTISQVQSGPEHEPEVSIQT